jgi:hypothetical protein
MTPPDFKAVAVLGVQLGMLVMLTRSLRPALRNPRYRVILAGLRARHFGRALGLFVVTGFIATVLIGRVPLMDVGWFGLLGGSGNIVVAQADAPRNAVRLSLFLPFALIAFACLIAPIAAFREERIFRRGTERQSPARRWWRQLVFGLTHLIMGIPVGAALAIGVTGGGFMGVYRRHYARRASRLDAVLESTRTHIAYNLVILLLAGLVATLVLFGPRVS